MPRKRIAAGNWKMNTLLNEGILLAGQLEQDWTDSSVEMIIAPPFTHLDAVVRLLRHSQIKVAAQNCNDKVSGAFTGDISPAMLLDIGVSHVIIGHSERRGFFGESDKLLCDKVNVALDAGLRVIFCCGEPLNVRESGNQDEYVQGQLERSLFQLNAEQMTRIVIAYEPIWAIGTGRTASPEQAQEMHAFIRGQLIGKYGETIASATSILYGGSVKPGNAADLFAQPDVDGGLVGGASLNAGDFLSIATSLIQNVKTVQ